MSFDLILQNAVRLHEQGRLDEAETAYRQLLEINQEHTDVLHLLGMIAMQKKSYDSAIELLYKAVRLAPQTIAYEFTLAQALQESGHPKEALEHYKVVLDQDDSLPEVYHNMGIIFRFQGETDRAKQMFQKAIDLRSDFSSAYVNLALIARDENLYPEALDFLDKAVQCDPRNPESYAQKAVTCRLMQRYSEALDLYEQALSLQSNNPVYLNGLGITFECLGRLDEAIDAYNRSVESDPSFADAYNNRANVLAKLGKHWEAEDDYKKAVKLDPSFASAYNNLGALLYDHGRWQEALECYRKAFIINPKQAETCCNLAMVVKETGDPAEAVGLYFNALALDPSLHKVHHYLAQTLYDLYRGEQDDAKEMAKNLAGKWKQFFPDNPIANYVCKTLNGEDISQADRAYVKEMFDDFADSFETTLAKLDYQTPEILKSFLEKKTQKIKILDAGCATGNNAFCLRPHASFLIGIDLSDKMVREARKKNMYDVLEETDITEFCNRNPSSFDLVVITDVMCYFGNIEPLLCAIFCALDDKGEVFLTFEKQEKGEENFVLQPCGRFAHNKNYVVNTLRHLGFHQVDAQDRILRYEDGKPVAGVVVTAEKITKINSKLDNNDKKD